MNIKDFVGIQAEVERLKKRKKRYPPDEKRHHIRLNTNNCVKINSARMDMILKATEVKGVTLSEFCKVAALREAKRTLLMYRKDRIAIARMILKQEEKRKKIKRFENWLDEEEEEDEI